MIALDFIQLRYNYIYCFLKVSLRFHRSTLLGHKVLYTNLRKDRLPCVRSSPESILVNYNEYTIKFDKTSGTESISHQCNEFSSFVELFEKNDEKNTRPLRDIRLSFYTFPNSYTKYWSDQRLILYNITLLQPRRNTFYRVVYPEPGVFCLTQIWSISEVWM